MKLEATVKGRYPYGHTAKMEGLTVETVTDTDADGEVVLRVQDPNNPDFWMHIHLTAADKQRIADTVVRVQTELKGDKVSR